MIVITPLSLYIINNVRLRRLTLGISAQSLSTILDHSLNYVITVESHLRDTSYPPHEWPKLAAALNCDIADLLPAEQSTSTGELVEKKVLSLNNEDDVRKVIAALDDHGFFDDEKTLEDVVKHLNIQDEGQVELLRKVLKE